MKLEKKINNLLFLCINIFFLKMIFIGGKNMETLQKILLVITIVGAVNWGLIGLFDFDLVAFIFGNMSLFTRVIYTVVAVCGLVNIGILFNHLETK